LHNSQKLISETDSEVVLELFICPTHDFMMELLSMGANVKVLEPKSLQKKIKKKLLDAVGMYE
jgi:predicted DNA-binding transcriptional regulator YafY